MVSRHSCARGVGWGGRGRKHPRGAQARCRVKTGKGTRTEGRSKKRGPVCAYEGGTRAARGSGGVLPLDMAAGACGRGKKVGEHCECVW